MIYQFRVILDAEEDVIRDIEIEASASMEDLHNAIFQSFGFGGQEMASFYLSDNDWEQGEEISLFAMEGETRAMADTPIESVVSESQNKLIYVYDFLNMWTFLVELAQTTEVETGKVYPNLLFVHGELPEKAPEKDFEAEDLDTGDALDFEDNDYDDLDFDENWN